MMGRWAQLPRGEEPSEGWGGWGRGVCACTPPTYNLGGKIQRSSCFSKSWLGINGVPKKIRTGRVLCSVRGCLYVGVMCRESCEGAEVGAPLHHDPPTREKHGGTGTGPGRLEGVTIEP